jgi:hypothetical protein
MLSRFRTFLVLDTLSSICGHIVFAEVASYLYVWARAGSFLLLQTGNAHFVKPRPTVG